MKTIKTTNEHIPHYVETMSAFKTNSVKAEWVTPEMYIVFSYETPIALFSVKAKKWIENIERYSKTTSMHINKIRSGMWGKVVTTNEDGIRAVIAQNAQKQA